MISIVFFWQGVKHEVSELYEKLQHVTDNMKTRSCRFGRAEDQYVSLKADCDRQMDGWTAWTDRKTT